MLLWPLISKQTSPSSPHDVSNDLPLVVPGGGTLSGHGPNACLQQWPPAAHHSPPCNLYTHISAHTHRCVRVSHHCAICTHTRIPAHTHRSVRVSHHRATCKHTHEVAVLVGVGSVLCCTTLKRFAIPLHQAIPVVSPVWACDTAQHMHTCVR